jgi:hypothetical protein
MNDQVTDPFLHPIPLTQILISHAVVGLIEETVYVLD